jgi:hypothetical protein
MTVELTEEKIQAHKDEIEAFLLERNFVRADPRDITGVNREIEFHIYLGKKGASVTLINRFDPEAIDEEFIKYDDQAIVNLYNLIGR